MSGVKHSAKNPDWGTPRWLAEAAAEVMGGIDLDPASTPEQNETIRAGRIYTKEDQGLAQDWSARSVFLNPPGGKIGKLSGPAVWWDKLVSHYLREDIDEAIFVAFSIEFLQTGQQVRSFDFAIAMCVPRSRIRFVGEGNRPSHASAILYLGPDVGKFVDVFEPFGTIVFPNR